MESPKADKGRQRWQATARQAAKQARRCYLPQVEQLHSTAQLADWVRASCTSGQVVVLLHEEATAPIASVQLPQSAKLPIIVGPEGGIGASETQALVDAGAQLVRLGPHVYAHRERRGCGASGVGTTRGPMGLTGVG